MHQNDDGTRSAEDVLRLVRALILELAPNPGGAHAENPRLIDDLAYHSLALLELAFTLEDEFGLEPIDAETARGIVTVNDVERYVLDRVLPGASGTQSLASFDQDSRA